MRVSRTLAAGLLGAAAVLGLERFGLLTESDRAELAGSAETNDAAAGTSGDGNMAAPAGVADPSLATDSPPAIDSPPRVDQPVAGDAPDSPAAGEASSGNSREDPGDERRRELLAMSDSYRSTTILAAIRDAGFTCTDMSRVRAAPAGMAAWWVTCEDGLAYWVGVGADGRLAIDLSPNHDGIYPAVIRGNGDELLPIAPDRGPNLILPVQPLPKRAPAPR